MLFRLLFIIHIYFNVSAIFAAGEISSESITTFSPLKHCQSFKVQVTHGEKYKLTFKTSPGPLSQTKTVYIKDLTDLESITNILTEVSENYCPLSLEQVSIDGIFTCQKQPLGEKPFTENYINFLNQIINVTDKSWNNCSHVSSLLKLQLSISQLDKNKILKMDQGRDLFTSLIKGVTDSKTDQIIDLYNECEVAGKSREFVENLILLEGKNQCLYPAPPGLLSFEDFYKIAAEAGEKFKNKGLLALNSKKNKITKFVAKKITQKVLDNVTKSLIPKDQVGKILKDSKIISELDGIDPDLIADYTKYILPNQAPLKLMDQALAPMVKHKFKDALKDVKHSDEIIESHILPTIRTSYDACIFEFKKDLGLVNIKSIKEKINHFKKKEVAFCEKNSDQCNLNSCTKKVNYSTTDKDVTDSGRIQSCILKAFNAGLTPTLTTILANQYYKINGAMKIAGKKITKRSFEAADEIRKCTKENLKLNNPDLVNNKYDIYHFVNPEKYVKSLTTCVKKEESSLTKFFSLEVLQNMEVFKDNFKKKKLQVLSNNIIDDSLSSCVKEQKKRVDETSLSPASCKPIIELRAASAIIPAIFNKTLKANNISKQQAAIINDKFKKCSDTSIKRANKELFNVAGPQPFLSPEKNKTYIRNSSTFYQCFSDGLNSTTSLIIDKTFSEREKKLLKDSKIKEELPKIIKKGKDLTKACFKQFYSQVKDWPGFLQLNKSGFIENTKEICTERATKFILPALVIKETNASIKDILKSNLLTKNFSELLTSINAKGVSNKEKILNLRQVFLTKNPTKDSNDFVEHFKVLIKNSIFTDIHSNIFQNIKNKNYNAYEVETLEKTLTPVCLEELHKVSESWPEQDIIKQKQQEKEKEELSPKKEIFPFLVDLISNSINYSIKANEYNSLQSKIQNICKKPSSFNSLKSLLANGNLNTIIESETYLKLTQAFSNFATEQCQDDLIKYEINITTRNKQKICSNEILTDREIALYRHNALQDSIDKALLVKFILERKNSALKTIDTHLDENFVKELMNNKGSINKYVSDNLVDFVFADIEVVSTVFNKVVAATFKDKSKGSFTDVFLSAQLINTVGISGHKFAKAEVIKRMNKVDGIDMKEKIFKEEAKVKIMQNFIARWRPSGIKYYLNWDKTPQNKKEEIYTLIFNGKIAPKYQSNLSKKQKKAKEKYMVKRITQYVLEDPIFSEDQKTFVEKLKAEITKSVTESIESDVKSSLNPLD